MRTSRVTDVVVGLHGLMALHGCAQSNTAPLVLRSEKAALARLVSLLGLKDVERGR
jgi:hypothetical protein